MENNADKLHKEASDARELQQDFVASLSLSDQALFAYENTHDTAGFAEGIANRSVTLRVYANIHESINLLILAKHEMLAAVEIARKHADVQALSMPLYSLAQIQEDLGELPQAVTSYQEAVEIMSHNPPPQHNRPEVLANMKIHMYACAYKAGDNTALEKAEASLEELIAVKNTSKYEQDVWVSGGHMRIAKAIYTNNPEKAHNHLMQAKQIIDSNPDLKLRQKQWEQLAATVKL